VALILKRHKLKSAWLETSQSSTPKQRIRDAFLEAQLALHGALAYSSC